MYCAEKDRRWNWRNEAALSAPGAAWEGPGKRPDIGDHRGGPQNWLSSLAPGYTANDERGASAVSFIGLQRNRAIYIQPNRGNNVSGAHLRSLAGRGHVMGIVAAVQSPPVRSE